jgi:hypothetical protein
VIRSRLLPDGTLEVPLRAETGAVVGDGTARIAPDDPAYAAALASHERDLAIERAAAPRNG